MDNKGNLPESEDIFDNFKNSVKKSDEISEITSANSENSKHSDTAPKKNAVVRILTGLLSFFTALFFILKKHIRSKKAIAFLSIIAVALVVLISLLVSRGNSRKDSSTVPYEPAKTVAEKYAKKLAVYDFDGLKDYDLVQTKKLVETVEEKDFDQYVESNISAQTDILGKNPKVKINELTLSGIRPADSGNLGDFLNKKLKLSFTDKDIRAGKTATVSVTKSGKGESITENFVLFLLKVKTDDGYRWKVINSTFKDTYAKKIGTYVSEDNDFASLYDDKNKSK